MNTLPANWYTYSVADGVTEDLPGIYIWSIEDRGEYVWQIQPHSPPDQGIRPQRGAHSGR